MLRCDAANIIKEGKWTLVTRSRPLDCSCWQIHVLLALGISNPWHCTVNICIRRSNAQRNLRPTKWRCSSILPAYLSKSALELSSSIEIMQIHATHLWLPLGKDVLTVQRGVFSAPYHPPNTILEDSQLQFCFCIHMDNISFVFLCTLWRLLSISQHSSNYTVMCTLTPIDIL